MSLLTFPIIASEASAARLLIIERGQFRALVVAEGV
jgi:hypothetical protein